MRPQKLLRDWKELWFTNQDTLTIRRGRFRIFRQVKSKPDPNGFEIEFAANVAYVHYVAQAVHLNHPEKNVLVNEAVNVLGVARQVGNRIVVDEGGIRRRLSSPSYKVNDKTRAGMGLTFSEHWKVYPKSPITIIGGAAGKVGG